MNVIFIGLFIILCISILLWINSPIWKERIKFFMINVVINPVIIVFWFLVYSTMRMCVRLFAKWGVYFIIIVSLFLVLGLFVTINVWVSWLTGAPWWDENGVESEVMAITTILIFVFAYLGMLIWNYCSDKSTRDFTGYLVDKVYKKGGVPNND